MEKLQLDRRILEQAPDRLNTGAQIYLEIVFDQGPLALEVMSQYPAFEEGKILKDFSGHDRVLTARRR